MAAKPRHATIVKEINRLMSATGWRRRRPDWDMEYSTNVYFDGHIGRKTEERCHLLGRSFPIETVHFTVFHEGGSWSTQEIGRRNPAATGHFWWDETSKFYQSVKKSIELKRERQELARACRRLPKGLEKPKARRL